MSCHLGSVVRRVLKVARYLSGPVSIQKIVLFGGSFNASFGSTLLGNLNCRKFHLNYHFRALLLRLLSPSPKAISSGKGLRRSHEPSRSGRRNRNALSAEIIKTFSRRRCRSLSAFLVDSGYWPNVMAAESIKKELSGIFERLNTLSPSEKNSLLVFFKCFLPPNFSDGETSDQQLTQSSEETGSKEEVIPASSQGILPNPSGNTLSLVDNSANYAPDMYSFHCPAQTLDKSVNVPEEGVQTNKSTDVSSEHSPTNETPQPQTNRVSLLYCPICREEFNTWPLMEEHLYESHVTPIAPVCWRCQGVFANHSLLLAHECFDWGRLNLPCQAVVDGSTVATSRRRAILQNSSHLDYPPDGVFLKRRCGLCFKSTALFTNYHSFRRHKESEHPSDSTQILSNAVRPRWNKHKRFDTNFEDEFSHPQSVETLRSTLQRLMTQFQAQPKDHCAKSNKRRKRFFRSRAKRLSAAQSASLLHAHSSSCTSSPRPDSVTDDATDTPAAVPSNDFIAPCSTGFTTGTNCWRSYPGYSGNMSLSKRLRLHRKRAPVVSTTRDSPYLRGSRYDNPYNRSYGTMIGRFACKCCSATFRVASRLR
ncbi:hypothetical protein X801_02174, partial [Opisthorchis viverrini]